MEGEMDYLIIIIVLAISIKINELLMYYFG